MLRSQNRILTTHVGSLPRPRELIGTLADKDFGRPYDEATLSAGVRRSVADIVGRQCDLGIDIVGDGEHSKFSFFSYTRTRMSGFEERAAASEDEQSEVFVSQRHTRDSSAFPDVYKDLALMFGARGRDYAPRPGPLPEVVCTSAISYIGQKEVAKDIENLRRAMDGRAPEEAFITAIAPTNLELYFKNEFYPSHEEFLFALADAMREEFRAIVDAGFVLQVDDPQLATHYNRFPDLSIEQCRKFIAQRIEVLNYALRGIPQDRVRYHTCYSINVAPRVHDLELRHYLDLMMKVNASAYLVEAANPRHEHEYELWGEIGLPDGKILAPGVVSHCVYLVEHPELVAQRIVRFANAIGRENVLASTDCGFASAAAGDQVHPDVCWAKLRSLTEGAGLASKQLWRRS